LHLELLLKANPNYLYRGANFVRQTSELRHFFLKPNTKVAKVASLFKSAKINTTCAVPYKVNAGMSDN
jgi:hypothetical protein